jgi:uncharacterized membrane protein YqaE (UPF0057 family)
MLIVLVFLCPPLAVLLTAPSSHAAKNLGLTLLFYVPGVLHARAVVEQYTVKRRYAVLMQLLDERTPTPSGSRALERNRRASQSHAA